MKKYVLLLFLLMFNYVFVTAAEFNFRTDVEVGKQPQAVFSDEAGNIHVFCSGYDANYDLVQDEGDEAPSWWILNTSDNTAEKVHEFDWGYSWSFPFRPAIDDGKIYIPAASTVEAYNMETRELIDADFAPYSSNGVSVFNGYMFISVRDWATDDNYIVVYDMANKDSLYRIDAGDNVQQTLPYSHQGAFHLAVLNEGGYGSSNSSLQVFNMSSDITSANVSEEYNIALGDAGNHLIMKDSFIVATINGSHKIKIFSILNDMEEVNIDLETEGWNGPRESFPISFEEVSGGSDMPYTLISTYDSNTDGKGKVLVYHSVEGTYQATLETHGKSEGLLVKDNVLYIANINQAGTYDPDNFITLYDLSPNSVEDDLLKDISLYPNPVYAKTKLDLNGDLYSTKGCTVEIVSYTGKLIDRYDNIRDELTIDADYQCMPAGKYYVKIIDGNRKKIIPFIVVR